MKVIIKSRGRTTTTVPTAVFTVVLIFAVHLHKWNVPIVVSAFTRIVTWNYQTTIQQHREKQQALSKVCFLPSGSSFQQMHTQQRDQSSSIIAKPRTVAFVATSSSSSSSPSRRSKRDEQRARRQEQQEEQLLPLKQRIPRIIAIVPLLRSRNRKKKTSIQDKIDKTTALYFPSNQTNNDDLDTIEIRTKNNNITNNNDDDDNNDNDTKKNTTNVNSAIQSWFLAIHNEVKSYQTVKYPTTTSTKAAGAVFQRNILRRIEPYLKYPFRRIRNLFRGNKQEEIDAFNDIIISDVLLDDDDIIDADIDTNEIGRTSLVTQPTTDSTSSISSSLSVQSTQQQQQQTGRSDIAPKGVDLSGKWTIIVDDEFKRQYDKYLMFLGQPVLVRSIALSIVGYTTEETIQTDNGRSLFIRGTNARGIWERTLVTSPGDEARTTPILTVDNETVEAEAWWDLSSQRHISWLRGVQKYGGGNFESQRYLLHQQQQQQSSSTTTNPLKSSSPLLVCETVFHPNDPSREKATVTWKFQRN